MWRIFVHTSLGASGITSLLSAISHYFLMQVPIVVPAIELMQFVAEVVLWVIAVRTKRYRQVFPFQLALAFSGMSLVLLLGGANFISNAFWISIIAPVYIAVSYRLLGITFFGLSLGLLFLFEKIYSPDQSSMTAIIALDAVFFTIAMMAFVLIVKHWNSRLSSQVAIAQASVDTLERQRTQYLVHLNHELRNPLTALATSAELLEAASSSLTEVTKDDSRASRVVPLVKTIKATTTHLLAILNDVLDIERLGSFTPEASPQGRFSLQGLVMDVTDIYAAQADKAGCSLSVHCPDALQGDWIGVPHRVRQVMFNLIANAIKHAPNSKITVSVAAHRRGVQLTVADTGPGLSDRARSVLFQPYASSLGANGTSGLGLSICKLIVEKELHGTIQVISTPGKGTAFTVVVPLERAAGELSGSAVPEVSAPKQPEPAAHDDEVGPLSGKSLLLIDDDADNLMVLTMALEDFGMKVKTAQTAQDALGILARERFDLTLLDNNLGPQSSCGGVELAKQIAGGAAGTVVGYTGNFSSDVERRWRSSGVRHILRKPASVESLTTTLVAATCSTAI